MNNTQNTQETCQEQIDEAYNSRITELRYLWAAETQNIEADPENLLIYLNGTEYNVADFFESLIRDRDLIESLLAIDDPEDMEERITELIDAEIGRFNEYGLAFDYVPADTFIDQDIGYFRYQISYGGPSEEFRFYTDPGFNLFKIEFWFLDWFGGVSKTLRDEDKELLNEIFEYFKDVGIIQSEYDNATK